MSPALLTLASLCSEAAPLLPLETQLQTAIFPWMSSWHLNPNLGNKTPLASSPLISSTHIPSSSGQASPTSSQTSPVQSHQAVHTLHRADISLMLHFSDDFRINCLTGLLHSASEQFSQTVPCAASPRSSCPKASHHNVLTPNHGQKPL